MCLTIIARFPYISEVHVIMKAADPLDYSVYKHYCTGSEIIGLMFEKNRKKMVCPSNFLLYSKCRIS